MMLHGKISTNQKKKIRCKHIEKHLHLITLLLIDHMCRDYKTIGKHNNTELVELFYTATKLLWTFSPLPSKQG